MRVRSTGDVHAQLRSGLAFRADRIVRGQLTRYKVQHPVTFRVVDEGASDRATLELASRLARQSAPLKATLMQPGKDEGVGHDVQPLQLLARPEGFEPPTPWFVAKYSIQMSYGRGVLIGDWTFRPRLSGKRRMAAAIS